MSHPIADEFLLDHATGAASPAIGLLVATHLALNPEARSAYRGIEAVGGALLEAIEPEAVDGDALQRVLARIDAAAPRGTATPAPARAERHDASGLPRPLAALIPQGIEALAWRQVVRGVEESTLAVGDGSGPRVALLRIAAGRAIPEHTHRGDELTLVLEGAFADAYGDYRRGDVCTADASLTHRPTADRARDCLCLIVTDGPIRLTGKLMRLLNPFLPR